MKVILAIIVVYCIRGKLLLNCFKLALLNFWVSTTGTEHFSAAYFGYFISQLFILNSVYRGSFEWVIITLGTDLATELEIVSL